MCHLNAFRRAMEDGAISESVEEPLVDSAVPVGDEAHVRHLRVYVSSYVSISYYNTCVQVLSEIRFFLGSPDPVPPPIFTALNAALSASLPHSHTVILSYLSAIADVCQRHDENRGAAGPEYVMAEYTFFGV